MPCDLSSVSVFYPGLDGELGLVSVILPWPLRSGHRSPGGGAATSDPTPFAERANPVMKHLPLSEVGHAQRCISLLRANRGSGLLGRGCVFVCLGQSLQQRPLNSRTELP